MCDLPWTEKYRPKILADIELSSFICKNMQDIIKNKNFPNLILTGPPGVGKTTTIFCISNEIYGDTNGSSDNILSLNASDERGITSIEKIELFCKGKIKNKSQKKIILLDEADNITTNGQNAIRSLMEKYYLTTRFAFTCNTSENIIESIQSMCVIFRFQKLKKENFTRKIITICEKENVKYKDNGIDEIYKITNGDLRQGINIIQLCHASAKIVDDINVYKICDIPDNVTIADIINACNKNDVRYCIKKIQELLSDGHESIDILYGLFNYIRYNSSSHLTTENKTRTGDSKNLHVYDKNKNRANHLASIICGYINRNMIGIDSKLQLYACIAEMCKKID